MKKNKELSFKELVGLVSKPELIDRETAFRIFNFVADPWGYFKEGFDPYRHTNELFYNLLFDEYGDPHQYIIDFLSDYLDSYNVEWKSDLVKLYHSMYMDSMTHGNYSTIYAWR